MGTALLQIVLAAVTWFAYSVPAAEAGTRFQLEFVLEWIPAFGAQFALGIDGIALVMIALIAFLVPGLMLFSWEEKLPEGRTASGYFALLLATEATLMGVFAATDVFLFYVFFEAMLIPMYFLIGRFGGAAPAVRGGEVLPVLAARRPDHAGVADRAVRGERGVPARGRHVQLGDAAHDRPADPRVHPDLAVPRLLRRVRDQGAAGAAAHLAARRRCRGADRGGRAAGRRARQGRHVRLPALLPAAVPAGQPAARAAGAGALGDRHPVRGAARGRAEGHEAVRRLHLDRPLRLHRAGHLRLLHAGVRGLGALHGQPRPLHRHAVRHGRPARRARRVAADRRLRRRREARAGARRVLPAGRALVAGAAGHELVRQRVPGAGRLVPARAGVHGPRHRRHRVRRPVRAVGLPADDAGAGARQGGARRARRGAAPAAPAR